MSRTLMVGLLLAVAGATRVVGAQAPASGIAPGRALDPRIDQALREQLRAGYDQRRDSSGILRPFTADRPLVRQVPVVPESIPSLVQGLSARRCPMPVAKADVRSLAPMPIARADSARLEKMPVARPACVNPLEPK